MSLPRDSSISILHLSVGCWDCTWLYMDFRSSCSSAWPSKPSPQTQGHLQKMISSNTVDSGRWPGNQPFWKEVNSSGVACCRRGCRPGGVLFFIEDVCPAQEAGEGSSHQRQRGKGEGGSSGAAAGWNHSEVPGKRKAVLGKEEKTKADRRQLTLAKTKGQDNLEVLVGVCRRPQGGEGAAGRPIHHFSRSSTRHHLLIRT